MLHGRHDRKSNAVALNATAAILCDQDEFGKTIGAAGNTVFGRSKPSNPVPGWTPVGVEKTSADTT